MTIAVLVYLGLKVHWPEIERQLAQSDPFWILVAFLLIGVAFLLGSIRWWLLLKVQEVLVPLKVATSLTLIGQFFNSFLLGTTGGDIIKALYILKYSPDKKTHATLSVIMDRIMGLFVFLCCGLVTLPWQLRFLMQREETKIMIYVILILFASILVAAVSLLLIPFQQLPSPFHRLWKKIPQRHTIALLTGGFRQHGRSRRLTLEAVLYSLAACFLFFSAAYCIALATHLHISFMRILTIITTVIAVTSLPISIGGHGLREGMFVLMFSVFGIVTLDNQTGAGEEPAILFSVLFFSLFLGWSLVGGLVYLSFNNSIRNNSGVSQIVSVKDPGEMV